MENAAQATAQPQGNVPNFDYFVNQAKELGELAGKGGNTGITFLLEIIEGGYCGTLTSDTEKHGDGQGDHDKLAAIYSQSRGLANKFNAKAGNQRKLRSDLKTGIDFGGNPKWGHGQPLGVVNDGMAEWNALKKANTDGLLDAYNFVLRLIRVQKKQDLLLDKEALKNLCFKPGAKPVTIERVYEQLRKACMRLAAGSFPNCKEVDDSAENKAIQQACTRRLTAIAKERGAGNQPAKAQKKAA